MSLSLPLSHTHPHTHTHIQMLSAEDWRLSAREGEAGVTAHLGLAALELAREEVPQPALQERDDAAEEEDPDAPHGGPEAAPGALAHGSGVEAVVDEVLEVLAHADLAHEAVLVAVHAGELPDMAERVLEAVSELEGVDVAQAELDVAVYHQLGEAEDLAANCASEGRGGRRDVRTTFHISGKEP